MFNYILVESALTTEKARTLKLDLLSKGFQYVEMIKIDDDKYDIIISHPSIVDDLPEIVIDLIEKGYFDAVIKEN